ncbi:ATP-binding protein [Streptomonospora sp. S1-112]|uniref:ATP-binding protein n=1 Tax=Streptomonospora mangrovi TaxID=2883123 RepID=A0A9X3NN04_9ACTN|nr:ATP-binding protein [Streptomonospora mangrovi]MDA0565945.1 ATP-binding protein [Streptomonospora mangrovi]
MSVVKRCRAFSSYVDQVAHARAWLDVTLGDIGPVPEAARAAAVLLLSEAVTNAILHTQTRTITVRVEVAPGRVRVETEDEGAPHSTPTVVAAPADAEHGRGLRIMSAFAEEWGPLNRRPGVYYVVAFAPEGAAAVT